jgi:hypothetical protein
LLLLLLVVVVVVVVVDAAATEYQMAHISLCASNPVYITTISGRPA